MKSLEHQLQEAQEENRQLRKQLGTGTLTQKLQESGLPAISQAKLRKRFGGTGNLAGIDTAIAEERDFVRKIRGGRGGSGKTQDLEESAAVKNDLVDGYKSMGLNDREARLAAGLESAVGDMDESQRNLYGAAKATGMSEAEAKAFATPPWRRGISW